MRIIKYYAKWCGPCNRIENVLSSVDSRHEITRIDVDEDKASADKAGVKWLPTVDVYDGETLVRRFDDEFTLDEINTVLQDK